VLVNHRGERFCDEKTSVAELSTQPEGKGWIVMDARIAAAFNQEPNAISTAPGIAFAYFDDYRRGRPDLVHEAGTSAELAAGCGLDAEALEESVHSGGLTPPLVAIGPCFSTLTVTEGALAVDCSLRVLDADGRPLPGLYAVGAVGQGGMMLLGHGHHIGWAMTSGRVAGETVARQLPQPVTP
jgi:fumarate reductase flavoprotein subunit